MAVIVMLLAMFLFILSYPIADHLLGGRYPELALYVTGFVWWATLSSLFIWLMHANKVDQRKRQASEPGFGSEFDSDSGGDGGD